MTSCQLFEVDLEALHDAELSRERAADVLRHTAACARCAATLERLRMITAVVRERAEPDPPELWSTLAPLLVALDDGLPFLAHAQPARSRAALPRRARRLGAGRPVTGWRRALPPLAIAAGLAGIGLLIVGRTPVAEAQNVVRKLNTYGAPVLVMPDDAATVIWLLDEPGAASGNDAGDRHVLEP